MYLTDQQVKDKLCEGEVEVVIVNYMPFASYLADRVARRCYTHDASDIKGEAYLALVVGVSRLLGHPNPRGFLTDLIRGHLINYVSRSHLIKRPDKEKRLEQWIYDEDVRGGNNEEESESTIPKELWEPFDRTEIEEHALTESILFSEIERKMLKLKIDGYTIEEIAKICQMPYVQTQRILFGTKSRVLKILKGDY